MQQNSTELIAGCVNGLGSISFIKLDYSSLTWTGKQIIFTIWIQMHPLYITSHCLVEILWLESQEKQQEFGFCCSPVGWLPCSRKPRQTSLHIHADDNKHGNTFIEDTVVYCLHQLNDPLHLISLQNHFLVLNSCPLLARELGSNITLCLLTFFLTQLNHISKHVIFSSVYFLFQRQRGVNKSSTRPAACSTVNTFNYCQRCSPGFCFAFCYLSSVLCSLRASLNYTRRLAITVTLPLVNEVPVSDEDASLS